jgi:transcriptional antiterminator
MSIRLSVFQYGATRLQLDRLFLFLFLFEGFNKYEGKKNKFCDSQYKETYVHV